MVDDNEKKRKRYGSTAVTSVSVSAEFQKLISQYDLSPTECFRRGVAVTLFDLGVGMYQSQKNEDRFKYVKEFLKKLDADEELSKQFNRIEMFEEIKKHLIAIKKIADEVAT